MTVVECTVFLLGLLERLISDKNPNIPLNQFHIYPF